MITYRPASVSRLPCPSEVYWQAPARNQATGVDMETIDLRSKIEDYAAFQREVGPKLCARVNTYISVRDGMYPEDARYYLRCGSDALRLVKDSLRVAGVNVGSIRSFLDYACGYGRVMRWLVAGFPRAEALGVDADQTAIGFCAENLGIQVQGADTTLTDRLERNFDLIWVGSLFTHVGEEYALRLLSYLKEHLTPIGVLVFTTHGPYVANRIHSGEKSYGLEARERQKLLREFDEGGYGFGAYPGRVDYGVSVCSAERIYGLMARANVTPIFYESRGWVRHQDGVAGMVCAWPR